MASRACTIYAVLSLSLLVAVASAGLYPAVASKPAFIAIGDGLTESAFSTENNGWGLQMQMKYTRKADIINRGYGGFYTTWFVDHMLNELWDVTNPTLGIIFLGLKDSLTRGVTGNQYIPPQQFGSNVQRIIDAGRAKGVRDFLIITPPPVCEACKAKTPKPWDRESAHTSLYVQQLQQLAKNNSAAFLDIFTQWQEDPDWHNRYLLPDKLHLSAQGNTQLFNQIVQTIKEQLPDYAPDNIAVNWPLMDVIDKNNPDAAFTKVIGSRETPTATDSKKALQYIESGTAVGKSMMSPSSAQQPQTSNSGTVSRSIDTWLAWLVCGLWCVKLGMRCWCSQL